MKVKDYVKNVRKEWVYDCYFMYSDDPKDYEKITRNKMYEEIYSFYEEDIQNVFHMISGEEFKLLKKIAKEGYFDHKLHNKNINSLKRKFLLISDEKYNYVISEEIQDVVQQLIDTFNETDFIVKDKRNELILGIIRTYGIIPVSKMPSVYNTYAEEKLNKDPKEFFALFTEERLLNEFYTLIRFNEEIAYIDDELLDFSEEIKEMWDYLPLVEANRTCEELRCIGKYGVNILEPSIKKFMDYIEEWSEYKKIDTLMNLRLVAHINQGAEGYFDYLHNHLFYRDLDKGEFECLFMEALIHMPSAGLFGNTAYEFKKFIDLNGVDDVQENAHLSEADKDIFYEVYLGLLEFVNKKYKVVPGLKKIYHRKSLNTKDMVAIRNVLYEHVEVIDEFIHKNPFYFSEELLSIVDDFRYGIKGIGVIVKYEKDCTIISMNDGNYYSVFGLTDNISVSIPSDLLPYPGEMVLLPFKDKIIYDGLVAAFPVNMSDKVKKIFDDNLNEKQLITTLYPKKDLLN